MRRIISCAVLAGFLTAGLGHFASADDAKSDRSKLEAEWSKKLSGATLVGVYTVAGKKSDKPAKTERYKLGAVKKLKGDTWLFTAMINYGGKNKTKVPLPLSLTVKWAGDTPVITMTDFSIPGMGTFTARVLFYGDRYVGTWQHGKVGGHMYGMIEPAKKTEEKKKD